MGLSQVWCVAWEEGFEGGVSSGKSQYVAVAGCLQAPIVGLTHPSKGSASSFTPTPGRRALDPVQRIHGHGSRT